MLSEYGSDYKSKIYRNIENISTTKNEIFDFKVNPQI